MSNCKFDKNIRQLIITGTHHRVAVNLLNTTVSRGIHNHWLTTTAMIDMRILPEDNLGPGNVALT